jgi:hypothetical protein
LLVSGNGNATPKTTIDAALDLDMLKEVDWFTVVFDKLKDGIDSWHSGNKGIKGCVFLLLVSILVAFLILCRDPVI